MAQKLLLVFIQSVTGFKIDLYSITRLIYRVGVIIQQCTPIHKCCDVWGHRGFFMCICLLVHVHGSVCVNISMTCSIDGTAGQVRFC